jgi:hypothetical protein
VPPSKTGISATSRRLLIEELHRLPVHPKEELSAIFAVQESLVGQLFLTAARIAARQSVVIGGEPDTAPALRMRRRCRVGATFGDEAFQAPGSRLPSVRSWMDW